MPTASDTLSLAEFQILLALGTGEAHGYAIMQEVERRFPGPGGVLGAGTLYGAIRRLRERELIEEKRDPEDSRRRTYLLTADGRAAAQAEAERHLGLIDWAREAGLVGGDVS